MLAIRMQHNGKTHHAMYRVIVQDSRKSPTSGNVVAYVGAYDPHAKEVSFDKAAVEQYLANGAQPTDRVAKLLKENGVKLPSWVKEPTRKSAKIRHPEKLRKNQPKETETETDQA